MKELFLLIAPYSTFFFLTTFIPEIVRNFRKKIYASGTLLSWILRLIICVIFGIYSLMIKEDVVGVVHIVAAILVSIIIFQWFRYKHAK